VMLPELFSCGYVPNRAVWDYAEPPGGPVSQWLAATAGRLGVYLGVGGAETDGTDFFNVFILAGPDGQIAGRAYKTNAEASVFRRGRNEHVIVTPAGRIGIGICADNQFSAQLRLMRDQRADVILMPHAWPTPARAAGLVSEADVAAQQRRMIELPVLYARALGVPVVFVNQAGPLLRIGGILGRLMDPAIWRLRGQSRIADSDGSVLGQLGEEEGVLIADAVMDAARQHYDPQPSYDGWLQPGAWAARHLIIPADIATGRLSYAASRKRRRKARFAAARAPGSTPLPAAGRPKARPA
ncbi:MAG TPA: carbon-nitrogen hydrolase family protein, partial [Streptosporangiaceae bacterium]|nr:carbon-nitrogen hydrolase family protein [Streptosporangiaceae bacterium]